MNTAEIESEIYKKKKKNNYDITVKVNNLPPKSELTIELI